MLTRLGINTDHRTVMKYLFRVHGLKAPVRPRGDIDSFRFRKNEELGRYIRYLNDMWNEDDVWPERL